MINLFYHFQAVLKFNSLELFKSPNMFRMILEFEHAEVIYGDGIAVHRGLKLPDNVITSFLEKFFRKLFRVDTNRGCHLCTDACGFAMTMHIGQPFQKRFRDCIPS